MIKTVYFDLGNVLIFFSLPKLFDQIGVCTGLSGLEVKKLLFETDLRESYEKGLVDIHHVYHNFQRNAKRSFSIEEFKSAFSDIFTPNLELWPIVETLKKKGIRLILLSNTSECHFHYICDHYPILQLFDHKVLSYEVGAWKPDRLIYQKALEQSHCRPEECFYTDDIAEFIDGARKAGLPGELFTDVANLKQHLSKRGCNFFA